MKSSLNRSTDSRIEEATRNQLMKPSHVTRIPKKPRRSSTRDRGGDLLDRKRPLSPMTTGLEKQTPPTRTTEQPGVGVTNPPLKKPRTDVQVESKPERQDLIDLIPSLTATEIARLVGAIRRKKLEGPHQNNKRARGQPVPTEKTETEEIRQPRPVTPESVGRITENVSRTTESHAFPRSEADAPIERNPMKPLETGVPSLADVLALRATRQGLPMFSLYMVHRIQECLVLVFVKSPSSSNHHHRVILAVWLFIPYGGNFYFSRSLKSKNGCYFSMAVNFVKVHLHRNGCFFPYLCYLNPLFLFYG